MYPDTGGYYQHQQRGRRQADVAVTVELKAAFADSGRSNGGRRLVSALQAQEALLAVIGYGA